MQGKKHLVAALAVATSLAAAGAAAAAPPIDTSRLRTAVTVDGIMEHQAALEQIANENPFEGVPTRATGTPGHEASVEYVTDKMEAAGFEVSLQEFGADIFFEQAPAVFEQVAPNEVTYQRYDGQEGVWYTAEFSGDGDATAQAVAVDFTEPTAVPSASDSGCEEQDFVDFPVDGKIALLQRGTCDFGLKVELAQAAGAIGAVIFNEGTIGAADRNDVLIPTLAGYDATIPAIGTDYATGRALVDEAADGDLVLHVEVDGFVDQDVVTNNVIAESAGGRSDRTVVVGGHLDSVHEGPGINDDGSGVSMMLETAEEMHEMGYTPRNKVRFVFFSGEEQGLLGSDFYVSQLTERQVKDISVMLDYDMLASGNYARFVYDGDGSDHGIAGPNGSGVVEQVFKDFWDSQGLAYETIPFDGRSDYDAFTAAGIPAGGIFAGAEVPKTPEQVTMYGGTAGLPFDPCYHQRCDTLANISKKGLLEHKDAAVHAIDTFARTNSSVNGTDRGSSTALKSWDWKGNHPVR
jgi:Zn-dependent M28 family amino/carboxypeptidase